MKTFKPFLAEADAAELKEYPNLSANPELQQDLRKILDMLITAKDAASFKQMRQTFNAFMDDALFYKGPRLEKSYFDYNDDQKNAFYDFTYGKYPSGAAGLSKYLNVAKKFLANPIVETLPDLKTKLEYYQKVIPELQALNKKLEAIKPAAEVKAAPVLKEKAALDISDLKNIVSKLSKPNVKNLEKAIQTINVAVDAGEIENADKNKLYTYLYKVYKELDDNLPGGKNYFDVPKDAPKAVHDFVTKSGLFYSLSSQFLSSDDDRWSKLIDMDIPANVANHPAIKPRLDYALAIVPEILKLNTVKKSLDDKAYSAKVRARAAEKVARIEREKAAIPSSTREIQKMVSDILRKSTDEVKGKYAKDTEDWYIKAAESAVKEYGTPKAIEKLFTSYPYNSKEDKEQTNALRYLSSLSDVVHTSKKEKVVELVPGYKGVAKKLGEEAAQRMQDAYVSKNVSKLAKIIEDKGNLKGEPDILSIDYRSGVITNIIKFLFQDSSEFKIKNQIVWATSVLGNPFYRFPATFHDVILPDGSKMSAPSEERMHTIFTKAK